VNSNAEPITSPKIRATKQSQGSKPQMEAKPQKKWWEFWKS